MRQYKPDMMTILVLVVAVGFVATASAQAEDSGNKFYVSSVDTPFCINAWKDIKTCVSASYKPS